MANNAGALRFWRTVAPQAAVQPPREADGEDGFWMLSLPGAPPTRASDQTAPPQDAQQVRVATPADTPAILAVDALAWRIPRAPGRSRGPSNRDNAGSRSTPAASWAM